MREVKLSQYHHTLYIHGLFGSSQGEKAQLLRLALPGVITPEFEGNLAARNAQLTTTLKPKVRWTLIGASLGGLMACLYARENPERLNQLILLAPALTLAEFHSGSPQPIKTPTIVFGGSDDDVIPIEQLEPIVRLYFTNAQFLIVDDTHGMEKTVGDQDWPSLVIK